MDKNEIQQKVLRIVERQFLVENLPMSTRFLEDLNADSLDSVELIIDIEDEFNLAIPDEKIGKMETIQDVADAIAEVRIIK